MVKEDEKIVFAYELDKLHDEYQKCTDLSMRQHIREDIIFLRKAIALSENEPDGYLNML